MPSHLETAEYMNSPFLKTQEYIFTSGHTEPVEVYARKIKESMSELSKPFIIKLLIEKCRTNTKVGLLLPLTLKV